MTRFAITFIALIALSLPAHAGHHHYRHHHTHHVVLSYGEASYGLGSLLPHPRGCPARQFCACGAAVEVFGSAIRSLWPAVAWYRFPRTSPAPGMVGVRSHHVFVLRQQIEGSVWLIADYNSGHHQSRLHQRNIAGYVIVDPHNHHALIDNSLRVSSSDIGLYSHDPS